MGNDPPSLMRILVREVIGRASRFQLLSWLVRNVPGEFGVALRSRLLAPYLGASGANLMIHPGVKIRNPQNLFVGKNVGIGEDVFIQAGGGVEIGDNVSLGPGVKIWSQNHRIAGTEAVNSIDYEYKKVVVESDVWIASNAFIMPGTVLKKGTVVSACTVVSAKSYPEYAVISGFPARVIRIRTPDASGEVERSEIAPT